MQPNGCMFWVGQKGEVAISFAFLGSLAYIYCKLALSWTSAYLYGKVCFMTSSRLKLSHVIRYKRFHKNDNHLVQIGKLMNTTAILYPAFAMFSLTLFCVFRLGLMRFLAIKAGKVKISFYRTYNEGSQPDYLHLMSRHVQNHFEIPPLFYAGVILSFMTGNDGFISVVFAWLFVAARFVHSFIHLTNNNVNYRFLTFGFSLICLCVLWASILYGLM